MPTTPNFALPFPLDTDPADVPADMEELADAVDSALGQVGTASVPQSLVDAKGDLLVGSAPDTVARVPVGTNGYVLAADSPSPAGVKWIQLAGAYVAVADKGVPNGVASLDATGKVPSAQLPTIPPSGIQPTIIDAKGDLIAGAANDTPQRFAVGADGQALVADSTQPQGLKWATPSGGGGGGIDPAIFDAKGDVLIASAPDTPARLAVGANGQVLTADPSAANGLRYGERIDYENVYSAGTAYQPGDVVTYNGVTYLCVNPATGQTPPAVTGGGGASVQVVTTLPASPTDGLEVILVDSLTLPTYAWHLKYQAGIIDANKWVYVGGSPLEHDITAAEVTNSATYVDLATVGPQVTVPRAGVYLIDLAIGASYVGVSTAAGVQRFAAVKLGAAATSDNEAVLAGDNSTASSYGSGAASFRRTLAASDLVKVQYRATGGNGNTWARRSLKVTPVRVA